jgi:hypothetical protein
MQKRAVRVSVKAKNLLDTTSTYKKVSSKLALHIQNRLGTIVLRHKARGEKVLEGINGINQLARHDRRIMRNPCRGAV